MRICRNWNGENSRAEDVERHLHRAHHALDVVGVVAVVIDGQLDVVPAIARDLDSRADWIEKKCMIGASVRKRAVRRPFAVSLGDFVARRDRDLTGVGRDRDVGVHPIGVVAQIMELTRAIVFQPRHAQIRRQAVAAPARAILQQAAAIKAQHRATSCGR